MFDVDGHACRVDSHLELGWRHILQRVGSLWHQERIDQTEELHSVPVCLRSWGWYNAILTDKEYSPMFELRTSMLSKLCDHSWPKELGLKFLGLTGSGTQKEPKRNPLVNQSRSGR